MNNQMGMSLLELMITLSLSTFIIFGGFHLIGQQYEERANLDSRITYSYVLNSLSSIFENQISCNLNLENKILNSQDEFSFTEIRDERNSVLFEVGTSKTYTGFTSAGPVSFNSATLYLPHGLPTGIQVVPARVKYSLNSVQGVLEKEDKLSVIVDGTQKKIQRCAVWIDQNSYGKSCAVGEGIRSFNSAGDPVCAPVPQAPNFQCPQAPNEPVFCLQEENKCIIANQMGCQHYKLFCIEKCTPFPSSSTCKGQITTQGTCSFWSYSSSPRRFEECATNQVAKERPCNVTN